MRSRWGRWHGYMEELEEAMRVAGQHLGEVQELLDESYERDTWKGEKRDSADAEIVRRAHDIPFFRKLIETANRLESPLKLENQGFVGRDWKEGEERIEKLSAERCAIGVEALNSAHDDCAPARIVAAERALQNRTRSLVVVLDNLVNPRNISAIARTIEALGLQELHIISVRGQPSMERTLTTRSERWLDIISHRDQHAALEELRKRGYRILAADFGHGAVEVEAVPIEGKTALVFGSEQLGVSEMVREAADGLFFVPNSGFTAYMNVSVATALSVYVLDRRMRENHTREPLSKPEIEALRPAWYSMLGRGDKKKEAEYLAWAAHPPSVDRAK